MQRTVSPQDTGWAWTVSAAGCFLHIVVIGTVRSTGILLASVSEHYNRSKRDTSWIMGIFNLMFTLLTPITMAMARRYTARRVVLVGGIFLFLGYSLSYFAVSLEYLYVTIGLLAGTGMAMTHPPTVLLVSYYFNRQRTLAMGITMAGCSLGALCMPALLNVLIDQFTFRGSMLLWGALTLHVAVAGAFMRPFVGPGPEAVGAASLNGGEAATLTAAVSDGVKEPLVVEVAATRSGKRQQCDWICKSVENVPCSQREGDLRRTASAAALHPREQPRQLPSVLEFFIPPRLTLLTSCGDVSLVVGQAATTAAAAAAPTVAQASRAVALTTDDPAAPRERPPLLRRVLAAALHSLHSSRPLLCSFRFWFLLTGLAVAIQGMPLNFMILPQHGKSLGMPSAQYSRLLQYQGITDLVVRIGIGFLADRQLFRRQLLMVALILGQGALWCLLLHPSHEAALAFALLEGLLAGGLVTNVAPILVDTFGVDNLPITYGFMGILESGIVLGIPVLLGDMFDKTGSWNASIIFVSVMMASSGLMMLADDLIHQHCRNRAPAETVLLSG